MVIHKEQRVQRELNYAIVDEVDSILIDEARTPLIISGPGDKSTHLYTDANTFVLTLKRPIRWSTSWVDMIVLIAVPEDKIIEFESMVLELYEMISNTDVLEEIKKIKSIDECTFEK